MTMDQADRISLIKTLLDYVEAKTTSMADAPWRNDVSAYTCPERHKREEEILIRKRPLVMGLSCDWPNPGAYRTDDFAGVPILTVRGRDGTLRAFLNVCRHRGAKVADGCGSVHVPLSRLDLWQRRNAAADSRGSGVVSGRARRAVRSHSPAARREIRHGLGSTDAGARPRGKLRHRAVARRARARSRVME